MKPILDSRKLLAFVTLARCGSFTQTARELYLTQSAVSHAIKSLEDDLQCRLFERLGRKAKLTQSGVSLLEYASRILEDMQLARANLKAMDHPEDPRYTGPWQKVAGG
jgi:DNA-binding transcriptional LysR family regulator